MKRISMLIIAAAGGLAAYLYFARRGTDRRRGRAPQLLTNEALAKAVERRLRRVLADPRTVQCSVHEGVLTLRGTIEPGLLDSVLRAALAVSGVSSVVNQLETEGMPSIAAAQNMGNRGLTPI